MPFQPVSMHAIRSSNQRALAGYWSTLAGDRHFPTITEFDPQPKDHSPEQLILWDVERAGPNAGLCFRVRRLGLRAAETLGANLIGKTMDEVVPESLRAISLEGARECATGGCVVYNIITTIANGHQVDCERLLLPFGSGDVEQIVASLQLISFQGPVDRRDITGDFETRCHVSFAGRMSSEWATRNPSAPPARAAEPSEPARAHEPPPLADRPDKRRANRRKVFKTGKIYFGKSSEVCTVRDISATGASLEVAASTTVPDRFTLVLEMESASRVCAAVWRTERQIGVRFG